MKQQIIQSKLVGTPHLGETVRICAVIISCCEGTRQIDPWSADDSRYRRHNHHNPCCIDRCCCYCFYSCCCWCWCLSWSWCVPAAVLITVVGAATATTAACWCCRYVLLPVLPLRSCCCCRRHYCYLLLKVLVIGASAAPAGCSACAAAFQWFARRWTHVCAA